MVTNQLALTITYPDILARASVCL